MNDLDLIENYLTGQLPADEQTRFEAALRTDPALADALAFYVLARHTATADARAERRAEFDALRRKAGVPLPPDPVETPVVRPFWGRPVSWAAAASIVLLLGLGWYFLQPGTTPADATMAISRQVDAYVASHFVTLPTTMDGGTTDSLTIGINYVNKGQLPQAEAVFRAVLTRQPANENALKYAGIVALRLQKYDYAIELFHRLGERTDLFSNPGRFYEALARLKRGRPMDKEQAKKLLKEVIIKNLDEKPEATQLLNALL